MTNIEFIMLKRDIYYYSDIEPTDEEVWEIYDIMQLNPKTDLSTIVADYYYNY